jgi:AAA family ATP:ADP antiporter
MSAIAPATSPALPSRGPLERFLQLFTEVRGGEGAPLLLLTLNVFLILAAYYVMKPVRQALILDQPGGAAPNRSPMTSAGENLCKDSKLEP